MPSASVIRALRAPAVVLAGASLASAVTLVPEQDIILPSSGSASDPLEWLGANSPYFQGPNVNEISSKVPDGCTVQQAAYVVRHGSRYPDTGAYGEWTTLYEKIQNATFTATGELSFLQGWQPVLKNPATQIAQESITGYKELHDLGYELRVKYPDFYVDGNPFLVWSNLYTRVVQSAEMFVRGYLGPFSSTLGTIITVNSTGSPDALGNSLAPSDLCPNFDDDSGGDNVTIWDSIYLPPITERLNNLIVGDLEFTDDDVSLFPYLCGFESQITGDLSPWCGTFSDSELRQYEYAQDLRYYYGVGPGTTLEQTMFLPFLNSLVDLLADGPGQQGVYPNGSAYTVPDLIMAFANDGQIAELGAALGVWDNQPILPADEIPDNWYYVASHFVSMRGTVAFEVLNCDLSSTNPTEPGNPTTGPSPGSGYESGSGSRSSSSSSGSGGSSPQPESLGMNLNSGSNSLPDAMTSGETTSSLVSGDDITTHWRNNSASGNSSILIPSNSSILARQDASRFQLYRRELSNNATPSHNSSANQTYVRILLNDVVYPVTNCQDGPGRSCLLSTYKSFVQDRYAKSGSFYENCNVTDPDSPTEVLGASFFTNLTLSWLAEVTP